LPTKALHVAVMTTALPSIGTPPPLGAQWDVFVLDDYLYSLLLGQFLETLDPLIGVWSPSSHEKHAALRTLQSILGACLYAVTLWSSQLQTPGTKAVGLRAVMIHNSSSNSNNHNNSVRKTKIKYIVVTVVIPLAYQFLQRYTVQLQHYHHRHDSQSHNDMDTPPQQDHTTTMSQDEYERQSIARQRQYHVARQLCQWVEQGLPLCKLALLLSMLWQPQASASQSTTSIVLPPRISMLLAGLSFVNATTQPSSSLNGLAATSTPSSRFYVSYAHRRWFMEEALQTSRLVFGPVLVALKEARRLLVQSTLLQRLMAPRVALESATPLDAPCPLCHKYPIAIPYETNICDHIFCYTCLWKATQGGTSAPCPVCGQTIQSSRPVSLQRYRQAATATITETKDGEAMK
jgi:Pex2 / Pex12 amino terminal region/Zinc finger, C3HC4 type (RING finger)